MDGTNFQTNGNIPSRFDYSTKEDEEELKDAEQMTLEMDHVSDMLTRLASNDTEVSKAAQEEIDNYLFQKERRKEHDLAQKELTEECKTNSERTLINTTETIENRCRKLSEEYKTQVCVDRIRDYLLN